MKQRGARPATPAPKSPETTPEPATREPEAVPAPVVAPNEPKAAQTPVAAPVASKEPVSGLLGEATFQEAIPKSGPVRAGLRGTLWFKKVRENPELLEEAIGYYERVVEDSHQPLAFRGPLGTLLQEHPGLAFFYRSILTDAQQIRRYLELRADQVETAKYKWLMTSGEAKKMYGDLKTTEAAKFAKAESEVVELAANVRLMANVEHQLDNVALGFQDRGIMLNRIVDVRKEGHHEVFIDSGLETDTR